LKEQKEEEVRSREGLNGKMKRNDLGREELTRSDTKSFNSREK